MSSQQTKAAEPTPEQLLQMLDLQIAAQRSKRKGTARQRAALLAAGLLLILVAAGGALLLLVQLLEDLPRPAAGTPAVEMAVENSQ
jgi:cell division septal protein FtsQ